MDLLAAVVADEQALEVVQPGEGALDDPARSSQAGAVLPPVLVVVVAAISRDTAGAPTWTADHPAHRRHPFKERDQLCDVVAVAARQRPGKWDPACVD